MIPKELNQCQITLATVARCIDILLLMSEVKQCRARSVLGWETAWEHWVLLAVGQKLAISIAISDGGAS